MIGTLTVALAAAAIAGPSTLELRGGEGPGKGKHIVLLAGDEEYRSEEMLPQLARILSERHGFRCTVLFSQTAGGEIDPNESVRMPGLQALQTADLVVIMLRFRRWSDDDMARFAAYWRAGRPILALRTSTHAFAFPADSPSAFRRFSWDSREWPGGFGQQVLGETWVSHWGDHGTQATRGVAERPNHPILTGVRDVFGDTDVYEAAPPADAEVLMRGEVVAGMKPSDAPFVGRKRTARGTEQAVNDPMMPILWVRSAPNDVGGTNRVVTCTMGAASEMPNAGFRRLLVNACFWLTDVPVPRRLNVDLVGRFQPTPFGFNTFRKGRRPADD